MKNHPHFDNPPKFYAEFDLHISMGADLNRTPLKSIQPGEIKTTANIIKEAKNVLGLDPSIFDHRNKFKSLK